MKKDKDNEQLSLDGKSSDATATVPEKANFGLSGALAKDKATGNMKNGVVLKYSEPTDTARPTKQWRLYIFKGDNEPETLHIHRQSYFLVGRDPRIADIRTDHPSCSKQHAVIQFRSVPETSSTSQSAGVGPGGKKIARVVKPYLLDLGAPNKTFLNDQEIEDARYYELREKDTIRFGCSSRVYVLLHDESSGV